ncbi:MAG TPA: hypothetical protein VLA53_03815 [Nitrosopumilaceae archaeon]|nr:hypothetical protein [Nitrosopumilaceae archaeon]
MASKRRSKRSKRSKRRAAPAPTPKQMITVRAALNRAKRERDMARREGRRLKNSLVVRNRIIRELGAKLRRARRR